MESLESLINKIPGLDSTILDTKVLPYKQSICDPVVITDATPQTTKFCAPTIIPDSQRTAALQIELDKAQKMLNGLSFDIPPKFQNACSLDYVQQITDFINNDILVKNTATATEIKKIPQYLSDFWNNMVMFAYYYTIASRLNSTNVISQDTFNTIRASLFPAISASDEVSIVYLSRLPDFIKVLDGAISTTDINGYIANPLTIPTALAGGFSPIASKIDNRVSYSADGNYVISSSVNTSKNISSGIVYDSGNIHQIPTNDQISNNTYSTSPDKTKLNGVFDTFYTSICPLIVSYASISYVAGFIKSINWQTLVSSINVDGVNSSYNQLLTAYDGMNPSKITSYIRNKIASMQVCGQTIPDVADVVEPDTSIKDVNYNDYGSDEPLFTDIKYWQVYSNIINIVGLLPIYWRVGLLIPTPAGVLEIPVPIIWKPLLVIPTPIMTIVVFITIDGMIISPVVWALIQKPPFIPPTPPIIPPVPDFTPFPPKVPTIPGLPTIPDISSVIGIPSKPEINDLLKKFGIPPLPKFPPDIPDVQIPNMPTIPKLILKLPPTPKLSDVLKVLGLPTKFPGIPDDVIPDINSLFNYEFPSTPTLADLLKALGLPKFTLPVLPNIEDIKAMLRIVQCPSISGMFGMMGLLTVPSLANVGKLGLSLKSALPGMSAFDTFAGDTGVESRFLILFRGANQTIKLKTGVTALNLPLINGMDANPQLSRTLPFIKDDLPTYKRLSLLNAPLLLYINNWLSISTSYLGLP